MQCMRATHDACTCVCVCAPLYRGREEGGEGVNNAHTRARERADACALKRARARKHSHAHTHMHIHTRMHTRTCSRVGLVANLSIYPSIHITHTHTHTHTHIQVWWRSSGHSSLACRSPLSERAAAFREMLEDRGLGVGAAWVQHLAARALCSWSLPFS